MLFYLPFCMEQKGEGEGGAITSCYKAITCLEIPLDFHCECDNIQVPVNEVLRYLEAVRVNNYLVKESEWTP